MKILSYKYDIIRFKIDDTRRVYETTLKDMTTTKRAWMLKRQQCRILTDDEIASLAMTLIEEQGRLI